jgi:hypothetical protein
MPDACDEWRPDHWRVLTPSRRSSLRCRTAHAPPSRRGAALACPAPRTPAPSPPTWPGRHPALPLEVRLDALGAVVLDGLSYRRAARMVGTCKTEVGDSLDLLLGELAALGLCRPDGTFVATLQDLRERLAEMTEAGEAVCVDGLATRVQRPGGWANQKVLYDAKRRTHTAQGVALSTIHGDLLWCDGGWPGSCHEHELLDGQRLQLADQPVQPRDVLPGVLLVISLHHHQQLGQTACGLDDGPVQPLQLGLVLVPDLQPAPTRRCP